MSTEKEIEENDEIEIDATDFLAERLLIAEKEKARLAARDRKETLYRAAVDKRNEYVRKVAEINRRIKKLEAEREETAKALYSFQRSNEVALTRPGSKYPVTIAFDVRFEPVYY